MVVGRSSAPELDGRFEFLRADLAHLPSRVHTIVCPINRRFKAEAKALAEAKAIYERAAAAPHGKATVEKLAKNSAQMISQKSVAEVRQCPTHSLVAFVCSLLFLFRSCHVSSSALSGSEVSGVCVGRCARCIQWLCRARRRWEPTASPTSSPYATAPLQQPADDESQDRSWR